MRLRIISICIISIAAIAVTACSKGPDPVKVDLKNYATQILPIFDTESKALDAFSEVTGENFQNDATLQKALKGIVIPNTQLFLEQIRMMHPRTNAVSGLNKLYIDKAEANLRGFTMLSKAIDTHSETLAAKAKEELQMSQLYYLKWEKKIRELKGEEDE